MQGIIYGAVPEGDIRVEGIQPAESVGKKMKRAQNHAILCPLCYLGPVGEHQDIKMFPNGAGIPVGEQYYSQMCPVGRMPKGGGELSGRDS